jgi:hypothetical protein
MTMNKAMSTRRRNAIARQMTRATVGMNRWGLYDICLDGCVVVGNFPTMNVALEYFEAHYTPADKAPRKTASAAATTPESAAGEITEAIIESHTNGTVVTLQWTPEREAALRAECEDMAESVDWGSGLRYLNAVGGRPVDEWDYDNTWRICLHGKPMEAGR